jgi:hypothetical protein
MYKKHLQNVIDYLNGKIDLYNGQYNQSINVWNEAWDEMRFMGYDPQTVTGIKKYMQEQL